MSFGWIAQPAQPVKVGNDALALNGCPQNEGDEQNQQDPSHLLISVVARLIRVFTSVRSSGADLKPTET